MEIFILILRLVIGKRLPSSNEVLSKGLFFSGDKLIDYLNKNEQFTQLMDKYSEATRNKISYMIYAMIPTLWGILIMIIIVVIVLLWSLITY